MNAISSIALLITLGFCSACTRSDSTSTATSGTTDTDSTKFATLAEKQEFLERFVTFRRSYEELEFRIFVPDENPRSIPGPNDWNIRVAATVPADELDDWIKEMPEAEEQESRREARWISEIPNAPTDLSNFSWYQKARVTVGIDRESNTVLYWNSAM